MQILKCTQQLQTKNTLFNKNRTVSYKVTKAFSGTLAGAANVLTATPKVIPSGIHRKVGSAVNTVRNTFARILSPRKEEEGIALPTTRIGQGISEAIRNLMDPSASPTWAGNTRVTPTFIGDVAGGLERISTAFLSGENIGNQSPLKEQIKKTSEELAASREVEQSTRYKVPLWRQVPVLSALGGIPGGLGDIVDSFIQLQTDLGPNFWEKIKAGSKEFWGNFAKDAFGDWRSWDYLGVALFKIGRASITHGLRYIKNIFNKKEDSATFHLGKVAFKTASNLVRSLLRIAISPITDIGKAVTLDEKAAATKTSLWTAIKTGFAEGKAGKKAEESTETASAAEASTPATAPATEGSETAATETAAPTSEAESTT